MRQSDVGEGGLAARRRRRARYDAGVETLADHGVHEPLALLVVTPLLFQDGLHFGKKKKICLSKRLFCLRLAAAVLLKVAGRVHASCDKPRG